MHIAVCLDERDGMLFNQRRLSSDRVLIDRVLEKSEEKLLWMNEYSAKLFPEGDPCVRVAEDFLERAGDEDLCFVENADITPYCSRVKTITIYRWNRRYPSDRKFPIALFTPRWQLVSSTEFAGNSHEKITEEIYTL